MIWIANEIQGAHRGAIEWLNRISPPELSFNAVELEVVQIDQSAPAPNLRVVAGPILQGGGGGGGEVSPRNRRYQEFFEKLRTQLLTGRNNITRAKVSPLSWWGFSAGRSGFAVSAAFTIDGRFRVELYIDRGVKEHNDSAYAELREKQAYVQEEIGTELIWDPLPESRACRVYAAQEGTIDDGDEHLLELAAWAAPLMIRFKDVFGPLVRNIQFPEVGNQLAG